MANISGDGLHGIPKNITFNSVTATAGTFTTLTALGLIVPGTYLPDYSAADQGVTGSSNTIKYYVDTIGSTNKATIYLRHNSGSANTDYTFSTNETITSNITLRFEPGARLAIATGITVTINGGVDARLNQIFSCTGTGAISFGSGAAKEVYPEWWGAMGDNSTACASAINAAVDSGSPRVVFCDGTYLTTGNTITVAANIDIEWRNGAVLKLSAVSASHQIIAFSSTVTKSRIINPCIDINYSGSTYSPQGIVINGASNIIIDNPCIYNSAVERAWPNTGYGYGIYLLSTYRNIAINNPHIYDIGYGIITEPSSAGEKLRISGGTIEHMLGDGIEISVPTGSATQIAVDGVLMYNIGSNNTGRGLGVGADGSVTDLVVTNNKFYNVDQHGVHIENGVSRVIISSNTFSACGTLAEGTTGAAISVATSTGSSNNVKINDNLVIGDTDSDYGIYLGGSVAGEDISIANNTVSGIGNGVGIRVGSVWSKVFINNNLVKNSNGYGIAYYAKSGTIVNNICFDDQTPKTQTYGLTINNDLLSVTIKDNHIYGNLNKGIYLDSLTFPHFISNQKERLIDQSASATAYSDWVDMVYLGTRAYGAITCRADSVTGPMWSMGIWSFTWDGTTLTPTQIGINSSGNLAFSGTPANALQMNGNWLQVRFYNAGGDVANVRLDCEVSGSLVFK